MVAIVVLAVGVLAAAALQNNALQISGRTEIAQVAVELAESELSLQKSRVSGETNGFVPCESDTLNGYTCRYQVSACSFDGAAFNCQNPDEDEVDAYEISVEVAGPRKVEVPLSSIMAQRDIFAEDEDTP